MDEYFVPSRLTEARVERRLTKVALEEKSDISRVTISKLESGEIKKPMVETVFRLALALGKPVGHFFLPIDRHYSNVSPITFRESSKKTVREHEAVEVEIKRIQDSMQLLYSMIKPREINIPNLQISEMDPSDITDSEIEAAALATRDHWKLGNGAIKNMTTLLENNGIICFPKNKYKGAIESINCTYNLEGHILALLLYNKEVPFCRQRFTLAHELGHIIMHRYWSNEEYNNNRKRAEDQANRFASAFLMPITSFPSTVYSTSLNSLIELKKMWGVSIQAINRRMHDLKLITEEKYSNNQIEISRRKWRTKEPGDDMFPNEKPTYIEAGFSFVLGYGLTNPDRIRDALALNDIEICEIIGNRNIFMPNNDGYKFTPIL